MPGLGKHRPGSLLAALLMSLAMLAVSTYLLRDSVRLLRYGEHTVGTVLEIQMRRAPRGRRRQVAIVRLRGGAGTTDCVIGARPGDHVGMSVEMVYLPSRPEVCRVDRFHRIVGLPGAGFAVSALAILAILAVYDRERRRARF
jgi:hypothetical protein